MKKIIRPIFLIFSLIIVSCVGEVNRSNGRYQLGEVTVTTIHDYDPIPLDEYKHLNESDFANDVTEIVDEGLASYVDRQVTPDYSAANCIKYTENNLDKLRNKCIPYKREQFGKHGGANIAAYVKAAEKKGGAKAKKAAFYRAFAPLAVKIQSDTGYPASALLAQWAEETGWGTSRLLRKGNGIGGHSCFKRKSVVKYHVFKVPGKEKSGNINASCTYPRPKNEKHYYLTFETLEDSAYAQVQNLLYRKSTQKYYGKARHEISSAIQERRLANPRKVIDGLYGYAAFPPSYRNSLKKRIKRDNLERFDKITICKDGKN